ncbi:MAG TPA: envelope integrity protein Cei [Pseudonocardiaceae bacterium]|nr:envelope integrity protein Cei [Pseudonocardiaceae bacterium]
MVSEGFTRERGTARYRKRKPIPAIVIVVLLGLTAVIVWTKVIARASDVDAAVACTSASSASSVAPTPTKAAKAPAKPTKAATKPASGSALPYNALDKVAPEPAADVKVQVLNASTQRGAATQASSQLSQDGFQVAEPGNDPLYPQQDMNCRGQIRFGANGESAARTVSLLVPCTQLVKDSRQDATVDLAIGSDFTGVAPNTQAQQAIQQLAAWAAKHPTPKGGQQAQAGVLPKLNANLLAQAHSTQC